MKVRILGCSGGENRGEHSTCILVDDRLAIDAGALSANMTIKQIERVDYVLLSHCHFDHVKDLPLVADLIYGRRKTPLRVYSTANTIAALRRHIFNDFIWPDFTRLPNRDNPVMQFCTMPVGEPVDVGPYRVTAIPVNHPVESMGFIISGKNGSLAFSGDTGPTDRIWDELNHTVDLKAFLCEVSFPNHLQGVADASGHLTPRTLKQELAKTNKSGYKVYLYHLKPAYMALLKREIAALKNKRLSILKMDQIIRL